MKKDNAIKIGSRSNDSFRSKLFLPTLVAASFASGPITVLVALLLIDIGNSFSTTVGVTGQINTSYAVVAVIFAILTVALSLRFRYKSLFLLGLSLMAVSVLGCSLAPDFVTFLVFYSLSGAGYSIVNPMVFTFIGEQYPLERRTGAIGWIIAGGALVYVIGAPLIAAISGVAGWRFPLLVFALPILLITILLALFSLPNLAVRSQTLPEKLSFSSLRLIFFNRSAVACLAGDALRAAAFVAVVLYATSFFRQRFLVPTDYASIILLIGAVSYVMGSLSASRLVKKWGRKHSTVLNALFAGAFTISYVFVPDVWISIALMLMAS